MAPVPSDVAIQAARDGNLRLLKGLAIGLDLRGVKGPKGRTLLHLAAAEGRLDVCKFLVEASGLSVNSTSTEGETPVLLAAEAEGKGNNGTRGLLRYLLDRGGDPAMPDVRGSTPLHNAAEYGGFFALRSLVVSSLTGVSWKSCLDRGPCACVQTVCICTIWRSSGFVFDFRFVPAGYCKAVRLLLSKGVPVDSLSHRGTPLHLAAGYGHDQAVKILLEHGADPNRVVNHVNTPLMAACHAHSLECMKLLFKAGADVNFRSLSGPAVLFLAVDDGLTEIVNFLLEAGANPNIRDEDGKSPIMLAAAQEHRELVGILFPRTKPIPSMLDWSVDGIIRTMKYPHLVPRELVEEKIADAKTQGKEAFAKGDYLAAMYFYGLAMEKNPLDATLFANRSLCWLRLKEGEKALSDARHCKTLNPCWEKAWYREGAALSFLKKYKGAADAFKGALKIDPTNNEIKKAMREAMESLKSAARSREQNPQAAASV
ncbi:unnamed protein product [Urochloa decumbens]|uniref:Uncharacterized protein n=1 Tax=Urochloa decumbens TaxID=240449 RepID=A0ABC9GCZ6_9POAL